MNDNVLQFTPKKVQKKITPEEIEENVQKAIKARDDYINSLTGKRLEEAIEMQLKIDKALSKSGNLNNRLTIISGMMMDSFFKLNDILQDFVSTVKSS